MFKKVEGDQALLRQNGVFRPVEIYTFAGGLYAKLSGGYVRLKANGTTSKDGVSLHYLESDIPLFQDQFGRLATSGADGNKPVKLEIEGDKTTLLIAKE